MSTPSVCIVLFTKPAIPGRVKTRMQQGDGAFRLSAEEAAHLHWAFLEDVVETLEVFVASAPSGKAAVQIAWALDGKDEADAPPAIAGFEGRWGDWRSSSFPSTDRLPGFRQAGADLGERLWHGLSTAAQDHDLVIAVGSDHPELRSGVITTAWHRCQGSTDRAVFVPADDGGFVLVAMPAPTLHRAIFEGVDWSTSSVMSQCRERCVARDIDVVELAPAHDCDDPEALERLAARLRDTENRCRQTEAFLRDAELLGVVV